MIPAALLPMLDKKQFKKKRNRESSLWPIIQRVKAWCNADVLSIGAVLLYLPNTNRKGQYHKSIYEDLHCIWIVALVQRAVIDKTAKRISAPHVNIVIQVSFLTPHLSICARYH